MAREVNVGMGPCVVPLYPVSAWSSIRMNHEQKNDLWRLVGPTVNRGLMARMPLESIFMSCYLEGLLHGAGSAKENQQRKENSYDI